MLLSSQGYESPGDEGTCPRRSASKWQSPEQNPSILTLVSVISPATQISQCPSSAKERQGEMTKSCISNPAFLHAMGKLRGKSLKLSFPLLKTYSTQSLCVHQ